MDLNHRPMPYQRLISKEERVIMVLLAGFEPAKHNVVEQLGFEPRINAYQANVLGQAKL